MRIPTTRVLAAGVSAVAALALAVGAGSAAAAPNTGSAGGGTADVALSIDYAFDGCTITVANRGPDTALNVVVAPTTPVAILFGGLPKYLGSIPANTVELTSFQGCGLNISGPTRTYTAFATTADPNPANNAVTALNPR